MPVSNDMRRRPPIMIKSKKPYVNAQAKPDFFADTSTFVNIMEIQS